MHFYLSPTNTTLIRGLRDNKSTPQNSSKKLWTSPYVFGWAYNWESLPSNRKLTLHEINAIFRKFALILRDYVTDFNRFFNSQNLFLCRRKLKNGSFLLTIAILKHYNCLKGRLAADGSDGNGLQFENVSQSFQVVSACLYIYPQIKVISSVKFSKIFFSWVKLPTTNIRTV